MTHNDLAFVIRQATEKMVEHVGKVGPSPHVTKDYPNVYRVTIPGVGSQECFSIRDATDTAREHIYAFLHKWCWHEPHTFPSDWMPARLVHYVAKLRITKDGRRWMVLDKQEHGNPVQGHLLRRDADALARSMVRDDMAAAINEHLEGI